MEIRFLQDIAIIFGLAMVVLHFCHRLRLPTIIGFLLTGTLVGPHGLHLIEGVHEVEVLAEIGVVLLLFAIGLEFSFRELARLKKAVLLGGSLQVGLTIVMSLAIFSGLLGLAPNRGIFIGFLLALSSTAIVLRLFQEKGEIDTPQGQTVLAMLIFQDIVVVLMMLLTPLLAGSGGALSTELATLLAKGAVIIGLVVVGARFLVPSLLYQIAATRSREFFLLAVVALCLLVAWLTSLAGLSLGLGAFLAGLIISESEYSIAALGNITPFRDIFMSFFFVSIGMLLDINILISAPLEVGLLTGAVIGLKFVIVALAAVVLGLPLRQVMLAAVALSQIGEFSFVLSKVGLEYDFLAGERYQLFLAVSVLTMALTPLMIAAGPRVADFFVRLPLPRRLKSGLAPVAVSNDQVSERLDNHLVIIGFGLNGRHLSQAARAAGIPYVILETNPDTVRRERQRGEPIIYGDATHEAVLDHARIDTARLAVVAISDPVAARAITKLIRQLNPQVYLIVRTRFVAEMEVLAQLGADQVIPEEFETAVEIFTRVLNHYLVPQQEIDRLVAGVRADGYQMFRSLSKTLVSVCDSGVCLSDAEIKVIRVEAGAALVDQTLAAVRMRQAYGVTLLAVRRGGQTFTNPGGDWQIKADDELILFGPPARMPEMLNQCQPGMVGAT